MKSEGCLSPCHLLVAVRHRVRRCRHRRRCRHHSHGRLFFTLTPWDFHAATIAVVASAIVAVAVGSVVVAIDVVAIAAPVPLSPVPLSPSLLPLSLSPLPLSPVVFVLAMSMLLTPPRLPSVAIVLHVGDDDEDDKDCHWATTATMATKMTRLAMTTTATTMDAMSLEAAGGQCAAEVQLAAGAGEARISPPSPSLPLGVLTPLLLRSSLPRLPSAAVLSWFSSCSSFSLSSLLRRPRPHPANSFLAIVVASCKYRCHHRRRCHSPLLSL